MTSSRVIDARGLHAVSPPLQLGESPFWHPREQALYCCDIEARQVWRLQPPAAGSDGAWTPRHWQFGTEVGCVVPARDGGLVLARRDGLWHLDTASGAQRELAPMPYDPAEFRFNDGRCDAQGRLWVGSLVDSRRAPLAALYCYDRGRLQQMADGITVSNGLAFSPDGAAMYWADTTSHTVFAFDCDPASGRIANRRVLARFELRGDRPLSQYGGRPDGAAVDAEGCYWVAMYEGARVLRLSPAGEILSELRLPVRCPTMPCFGGPDLRTLFIATGRHKRPPDELAAQPLAGCVLAVRVEVPGLPAADCAT